MSRYAKSDHNTKTTNGHYFLKDMADFLLELND